MTAIFEGRYSESPYVSAVWQGYFEEDYAPLCPADTRWNLLFLKKGRHCQVLVEGAVSHSFTKKEFADTEFLVIQFETGTYLPQLPAGSLLDANILLEQDAGYAFCLDGASWEIPTYETVEMFVERLVHHDSLVYDPIIRANLEDKPVSDVSERTIRRRFLHATGLTPNIIQQIQRARQAAFLLEQETPILDVVYQTGYADQPHLTRSLKRFLGYTPTQFINTTIPQTCPICSRQGHFIDVCYKCSNQ